jgi:putative heme-binding domain-containing protein
MNHWCWPLLILLLPCAVCRGQSANHSSLESKRRDLDPDSVPERNPFTSANDLAMGQKLFERRCTQCHGAQGEGGRGVNLTTGEYRLGGSDRELYLTLRNGVSDTEMPGSRSKPIDLWRLVAYVRQLGSARAAEPAPGDPSAGRLVYENSGCARCHMIAGKGLDVGPDLTFVGRQRSLQHLRDSIINPSADIPLNYTTVLVTRLNGEKIKGIHLNEDDYSIQLRDLTGNPRSFLKSELREFMYDRDSLMPPYRSLSPVELDNLIAYLKSVSR